jgi:excisionase family DNA binding protein
MDTVIRVSKSGTSVTVICEKHPVGVAVKVGVQQFKREAFIWISVLSVRVSSISECAGGGRLRRRSSSDQIGKVEQQVMELVSKKTAAAASGEPLLLHASEVARMLGLGRSKVYEMLSNGELPVVRIGTAVRVPRQALLQWVDEQTQMAA